MSKCCGFPLLINPLYVKGWSRLKPVTVACSWCGRSPEEVEK